MRELTNGFDRSKAGGFRRCFTSFCFDEATNVGKRGSKLRNITDIPIECRLKTDIRKGEKRKREKKKFFFVKPPHTAVMEVIQVGDDPSSSNFVSVTGLLPKKNLEPARAAVAMIS